MSGLLADKDTAWASSMGGLLVLADWPRFFDGLSALYAGAVYGSTENGRTSIRLAGACSSSAPYRAAGKPVWAVGLSFDGKTRQFKGGVAEAVK